MKNNNYSHVLEVVAFTLNIESSFLLEGIIDKDEYIDTFISFFNKDGRKIIAIQLQEISPPSIGNSLIFSFYILINYFVTL